MTVKNKIDLQLFIEPSATVTKSSHFEAIYDGDHYDSAADAPIDDDTTCTTTTTLVQLIISHGNVFHPRSKITIVLPSPPRTDVGADTHADGQNNDTKKVHKIKIGENNLFEEVSHVLLSLPPLSSASSSSFFEENNDKDENDNESNTRIITVIGSYNQFAPRCQIHTNGTTIGNGNVFHSFSTLHLKYNELVIGSGNIFNPFIMIGTEQNDNVHVGDDDHQSGSANKHSFQNQVFFMLTSGPSSSLSASVSKPLSPTLQQNGRMRMKLMQRTNENGVRKNMADVVLLLSATKKILQMNHPMMSSSEGVKLID